MILFNPGLYIFTFVWFGVLGTLPVCTSRPFYLSPCIFILSAFHSNMVIQWSQQVLAFALLSFSCSDVTVGKAQV